jgi:hypothetical protein
VRLRFNPHLESRSLVTVANNQVCVKKRIHISNLTEPRQFKPCDMWDLPVFSSREDPDIKRKRPSEEKIISTLKEHEADASAADLSRCHGVAENSIGFNPSIADAFERPGNGLGGASCPKEECTRGSSNVKQLPWPTSPVSTRPSLVVN